jgi:hypothetical protein
MEQQALQEPRTMIEMLILLGRFLSVCHFG